jgi:hypothetical protein
MNISPYAMAHTVPEGVFAVYTETLYRACKGIAFTQNGQSLWV